MLAELERVQVTLHSMLSEPNVKKVNISKLCSKAKISRKNFLLAIWKDK